jgi:RNA polymerase sigma-70 factor (ECF subfamily)
LGAQGGAYRPSASFRTFFQRIVSRLCIDRARKMKPVYLDEVPDMPDNQPHVSARLAGEERGVVVRRALEALAPKQRMAVILRYYEDLDYRAIAETMETTEKAVERLLARARDALRVPLSRLSADESGSGGGFEPLARL